MLWIFRLVNLRRLFVLATGVYAAVGYTQTVLAENAEIPPDSSLTIQQYVELGVPEPTNEWSAQKFEEALRVLGEIPRSQLPRVGSSRSRLLFDRLLMSYGREFDLAYEAPPANESRGAARPPSFPTLYSTAHEDHLLFDREIVAIRAETLSRSIRTLPARAELLALARQFAQGTKDGVSEDARARSSKQLEKAEETAAQVSRQVRDQASELLAIAGVPEIKDPARQKLLESTQQLFPQLTKFLRKEDVTWIAVLVRGAASASFNASIRPGLLTVAEQLDGAESKS